MSPAPFSRSGSLHAGHFIGCKRLIRRETPGSIRVVGRDLAHEFGGIGSEVLLIHTALLVDHEAHDAGVSIGSGPCEQAKAADHIPVDDVVVLAAGCAL